MATAPVTSTASAEAATAAYRQAMAAAITDGQAKAQFLAEKAGATLGQVQSIGEGGGYIQCPEGVEYEGAQPDFGSAEARCSRRHPRPRREAPAQRRRSTKRPPKANTTKRHSARKSAAESCTLSTQVALVYQLG